MRTLHELPRFGDRWSSLYLEYGLLEQDGGALVFSNKSSITPLPIDQLGLILLGPGTTVTHAAMKVLAQNACLLAWVGQDGARMYAHSMGATFSARRLILQARLASDPEQRLQVARRMFSRRFPGVTLKDATMEQLRGMEGIRVRAFYADVAASYGIPWTGRRYDQDDWFEATPVNRALSTANACLYGICHAAIVSAGYSAGLGFIHVGKMLSFVYDIADLYKTELTIPLAFRFASSATEFLERNVRQGCREAFHRYGLMEKILPDIAEVLGAGDDLAEDPTELEGRAVSLADRTDSGSFPGTGVQEGSGRTLAEGVPEDPEQPKTNGPRAPDVERPDGTGV